jgi:hypothetical protein
MMRMKLAKNLLVTVFLIAAAVSGQLASAQVKLVPKNVTSRADPCAPIGQTADHRLVYSLKCDNLPGPPPSPLPPQAEAAPPPPPEPEIHRSGIFGLSYEVKRPDQ